MLSIWSISEAYIFIVGGLILASIGFYGLFTRRNIIKMLISAELLYNSAILEAIVFLHYFYPQAIDAIIFALVVIAVAAVDATLGIVLAIRLVKIYGVPDIDVAKKLREVE